MEESKKAGNRRESNPGHLWLELPVLCHCHDRRTSTNPHKSSSMGFLQWQSKDNIDRVEEVTLAAQSKEHMKWYPLVENPSHFCHMIRYTELSL